MPEILVQSLGREDPLERKWQPTLVYLPGKSHGQRSLAGYSPWVHKESDMTERAQTNKLKVHIQDENAHYSKDGNSPQIDL